MFLCEDLAIKFVFSILFLSSTANDNKSMNAEHGLVSSFATNNNIVSDVNQGQSKLQKSITDSFAESCPVYLNTSKQCFPTLKKKNSSFELYNITEETNKLNLTAERENLRLFAETSSDSNETIGLKAQAFVKESINYIFGLTESQKFFIAASYLLALWKFYGARLRPIIFKVRCKLFGKPKTAIQRNISINPSEKTILVQNDVARDEHMNTDDLPTDSSRERHVTTVEETTDSACDSHVDSDEEPNDLSCEEHVDNEDYIITTSSSVDDLPTATPNKQTTPPTTFPAQLKHSLSFNRSDSLSEESCDEDFPDEFFVFPTDCGNIGWILGDEHWEKIDSSQESLTSDDGGTDSTGIELGQSYDVACDLDSRASSRSSCHSPAPKEVVSCLSSASDEDPVTVATTSGWDDWIEETHQGNGEMNCGNHGNVDQWILECGDSNKSTLSNGGTSNVHHDDEPTNNSVHDCDLMSESYEDSFQLYRGEYSEHGSSVQESSFESENRVEVYNNIEPENLGAGDVNRWLSAENEIVQEDIMDTTFEQRVNNHVVAAAIFAGTFVLPCLIAAKLLK